MQVGQLREDVDGVVILCADAIRVRQSLQRRQIEGCTAAFQIELERHIENLAGTRDLGIQMPQGTCSQ